MRELKFFAILYGAINAQSGDGNFDRITDDDEFIEEGSAGGEIKTNDSVDSIQKAGFGASLGCKWDVFYENSEFFGCISWWWVLCFALIFGTIIGCWIPRCYRQAKKKRKMSRRKSTVSTNSQWMSTKAFFSCGKDQPEYLQGAPTSTYKSNYDISKIPDEVFEKP